MIELQDDCIMHMFARVHCLLTPSRQRSLHAAMDGWRAPTWVCRRLFWFHISTFDSSSTAGGASI